MNWNIKKVGLFFSIICLLVAFFGCAEINRQSESNKFINAEYYKEMHRPQIHFTPEVNWMNDPNGMFYYEGKYHLFYQYYPNSTVWGPMHWGHAESKDLVYWDHLPIGLFPDSIGCIFSGGAVVDNHNTSKLGSTDHPPIVATFTHHDFVGEKAKSNDFQKQSIAYSKDGGVNWIKYKNNPVIPNSEKIKDFRDPKVVWHEKTNKWILALAAYDRVKFYSSKNLIDWEFLSDFAIQGDNRLWECPDLFPMPVEDSKETKWVLIVSIQKEAPNGGTATSYFIGDFDGTNFISDKKNQKWLDWGTDNYAFVTWNNVPKTDGRTLGIGWMSNWQYAQVVPTEKWRSAMTLPRELRLYRVGNDYIIHSFPVKELEKLRKETIEINNKKISKEEVLEGDFDPLQSEFNFSIDLNKTTAKIFGIKFQNDIGEYFKIIFNKDEGKMFVDRTQSNKNKFSEKFSENVHSAPINFNKESMKFRLIMDASSAEIFIDNGEVSFTSIFFPTKKFNQTVFIADEGMWSITSYKVHGLSGIWAKKD